jgi:hypothetical protein
MAPPTAWLARLPVSHRRAADSRSHDCQSAVGRGGGYPNETSTTFLYARRPARAYFVSNASGMPARPVVIWGRRDGYPRARTKRLTPPCGRLPNALVVQSAMPGDPSAHYSPRPRQFHGNARSACRVRRCA